MIKSMTGYGEGVVRTENFTIISDIKSLNSRFLDLRINLPEIIKDLEAEIATVIRKVVSRGSITLSLEIIPNDRTVINEIYVDEKLLALYMEVFRRVGVDGNPSIEDIIALPDILSVRPKDDIVGKLKEHAMTAVDESLIKMIKMREIEGRSLYKDLSNRITSIVEISETIEEHRDTCRDKFLASLRERICQVIDEHIDISDERIAQEAAILSAKTDPTEELTRLKIHLSQFREALDDNKPVGSKLKFILQECNREADTIGAKGADIETSNAVIAIKEELERIREQISNVE
ncbi:MAG TPA: YicC family protein [candidate division Zixibacteria bacterium]|nr:YicC family protein [candidate division Zixibacteria bacterium]